MPTADCRLALIQRHQAWMSYSGEEAELSMLHIPTTSTTLGCPKRGARHRFLPALVGLAVILLGLVSMTFAAKHTPNPASIPLPISGTMDEKGIPVGWDLETFQNHHQIKLEPLKEDRKSTRLNSSH